MVIRSDGKHNVITVTLARLTKIIHLSSKLVPFRSRYENDSVHCTTKPSLKSFIAGVEHESLKQAFGEYGAAAQDKVEKVNQAREV